MITYTHYYIRKSGDLLPLRRSQETTPNNNFFMGTLRATGLPTGAIYWDVPGSPGKALYVR